MKSNQHIKSTKILKKVFSLDALSLRYQIDIQFNNFEGGVIFCFRDVEMHRRSSFFLSDAKYLLLFAFLYSYDDLNKTKRFNLIIIIIKRLKKIIIPFLVVYSFYIFV